MSLSKGSFNKVLLYATGGVRAAVRIVVLTRGRIDRPLRERAMPFEQLSREAFDHLRAAIGEIV